MLSPSLAFDAIGENNTVSRDSATIGRRTMTSLP